MPDNIRVEASDKPRPNDALFGRIHAALPQTQCTRCGYLDCAAYAEAIVSSAADINQCPPGGSEGIARLAAIIGRTEIPLNPENGSEGPRFVAVVDEQWCIGCTLCLDACPTDAIMGSNKMMHTVIEPHCTGCDLCIPVCPVDCISLENASGDRTGWDAWSEEAASQALTRYKLHSGRRTEIAGQSAKTLINLDKTDHNADRAAPVRASEPDSDAAVAGKKRAVIEAALARARVARQTRT